MEVNFNKKVLVSRSYRDFNLIYDGLETYYLFYKDNEQFKLISNELPEQLHRKLMTGEDRITSNTFKALSIDDTGKISSDDGRYTDLETKLIQTINKLVDKPASKLNICQELVRTLKDAYKDSELLSQLIGNCSDTIQGKLLELSSIHDTEKEDILDIEKTPINIDEQIEARRNPVLTVAEKETAKSILTAIRTDGLIAYLNDLLDDVHIGDHRNILRKTLMVQSIMMGKASFLSETVAEKEAGKSIEDDIVFSMITPPRYVFKKNDMTWSAFTRYGAISEEFFDRLIIPFGDFGGEKSFKKIEEVFDVCKQLITENYYSRSFSDSAKEGNGYEVTELTLTVDSFGVAYSTVLNSFTNDDEQLISRTLNSTPAPVNERDVMELIFYLDNPYSKQSKARARAVSKLKDFGLYMLSLVNNGMNIINPYQEVFINYAINSNSPKRELKQQLELFGAYCILTSYDCKTIGDYKVASIEQLSDYMNQINLENALIPYENDFLKMLMATGNKYELTILRDINLNEHILNVKDAEYVTEEEKEAILNQIREDGAITITECENNAIPHIWVRTYSDDDEQTRLTSKEQLSNQQLNELPTKLNMLYGIRGTSNIHTKTRVFFRVSDLKNIYGQRKAYKNIDDVPKLLNSLYEKGYLGKYEQKLGKENLYYLTPNCEKISSEFKAEKSFEDYWTSYKKETGL